MNISRNKMNLVTDKPSLYDALLPWSDDSANCGNCVWKRDLPTTVLSWLKVLAQHPAYLSRNFMLMPVY